MPMWHLRSQASRRRSDHEAHPPAPAHPTAHSRDRTVSMDSWGLSLSKYLWVVARLECPNCWRIEFKFTPSRSSSTAWRCRNPWAWTRFSIPALAASRGSNRRMYESSMGSQLRVQNNGAERLGLSCALRSIQASTRARAPVSIPTVLLLSPLPRWTRIVPALASMSLGRSSRASAIRRPLR